MEEPLKPEVFYGAAIAALVGLLFGLLLHTAWQKHPGGPQILSSRAEAAEPAHPEAEASTADAPPPDQAELAGLDTGYATPDPLPVTRLAPDMFDVQSAAADDNERQDADALVADAAPQAPPADVD